MIEGAMSMFSMLSYELFRRLYIFELFRRRIFFALDISHFCHMINARSRWRRDRNGTAVSAIFRIRENNWIEPHRKRTPWTHNKHTHTHTREKKNLYEDNIPCLRIICECVWLTVGENVIIGIEKISRGRNGNHRQSETQLAHVVTHIAIYLHFDYWKEEKKTVEFNWVILFGWRFRLIWRQDPPTTNYTRLRTRSQSFAIRVCDSAHWQGHVSHFWATCVWHALCWILHAQNMPQHCLERTYRACDKPFIHLVWAMWSRLPIVDGTR